MLDFRFSFFSILWAIATLFHYEAFHKWDQGSIVWIAALFVLIKPSQSYRLLILAVLQIGEVLLHLPQKHNHWLLAFLINFTLIFTFAIYALRKKSLSIDQKKFFNTFAPFARMQVIILYFFAVLHKLNADFFDPALSCGSQFYHAMADRFFFLPYSPMLEIVTIYATLLIEASLPLLLICKKTRHIGLIFALFFHGIIGFNPLSEFWNFSAIIYALLFLFAPAAFYDWCKELKIKKFIIKYRWNFLLSAVIYCLFSQFYSAKIFEVYSGLILWSLFSAFCILLFFKYLISKHPPSLLKEKKSYNAVLFVIPIFMVFNGLSPYLGLKTESSFSMFSNLRTENGQSNHLFIPVSWQIFSYQKDLIDIIDSSDPYLMQIKKEDQLLPAISLHQYAQIQKDFSVKYIQNGVLKIVKHSKQNSELQKVNYFFEKSFLIFKPIYKHVIPGSR